MREAVLTASKYRYQIEPDALARLLAYEARHRGDGTLMRKLTELPGVHDVAYNANKNGTAVHFTIEAEANTKKAVSNVTDVIELHLKDIK